jgi:uncharacterized membrane protein HdeD (DUF308 family)
MKTLGIILIVIGIGMFIVPSISLNTEETIIDAGPIQVNKTNKNKVVWPNYAGGIAIIAGVLVLVGARRK